MCFCLIILLSSLSLASSQSYELPTHYFINCGSYSDIDFTGQKFVGDDKPSSTFKVNGGRAAVENTNSASNGPAIYRTARVFVKKSWYDLQADRINTFVMVRLHFSPFSSDEFQSSTSQFDVSVSGFPLLSNYSVANMNTIDVKEFIIPIRSDLKFMIEFTPSGGSKCAYVNAIEAFTTPSNLIRDASVPGISPAGNHGDFEKLATNYAFNPIYRINVGGNTIDETRDTLRRTWIPDDSFIFSHEATENVSFHDRINYMTGGATRYDAPDDVYNTAKHLNNTLVNVTWIFRVNKSGSYLVRAHFCDIVSRVLIDPSYAFNLYVYSQHKEIIRPVTTNVLQQPFFQDFVVDSGESRFVNISIGAIRDNKQPVLLNGVEIMELLKNSGVVDSPNTGKKSRTVYMVVGCVIGAVALLLVLLAGFVFGLRYGKRKPVVGSKPESQSVQLYGRSSYSSINMDFTINHPSPIPNLNLNLRIPFADIVQATNSFDEKLVIGRGGFGKVYKGTLVHGAKVAVKRGEIGHGQGRPEFVTEIMVLSSIRHRHLVSLIGYCDEKSEMILVYEFMEKGTLQDHLYEKNDVHPKLLWKQRLEICISAARGLDYLHRDRGIIHRDMKSTNILLNEHYLAKVADFGISRLDNMDESEMSDVKGSFGYLDPEYISCMKLTQKSDVYSFGVVLLEVLCARPALDPRLPRDDMNLVDWAIREIKNGKIETIIDPFLEGTIDRSSLRKFVETVERCLKDTGDERPNMMDVLWDLEYALKLQQMLAENDPYDDSTMNTSLQLPMSMIHRLPSYSNDDPGVNDSWASSLPRESQVFSQLNMDEAR